MTYQETLDYLYNTTPMFQQIGSKAYKEGLENTYILDEYFGHPHTQYKTIHIAGTNGKGTTSHTLAAILQESGYKVGLYTSPHLIDFSERIRVNGKPILQDYVIEFTEKHRHFFEPLQPTFFELTTAMAFRYFADCKVDVAIIEVGLGGRLDCTNIIHPDLSIITNISLDHTNLLGKGLTDIAKEKAGIIKKDIPVIIGESVPATRQVFAEKAREIHALIFFAEEQPEVESAENNKDGNWVYQTKDYQHLEGELGGLYQLKNTNTILTAVHELKKKGYRITEEAVRNGFKHVVELTGLMGRWQKLNDSPTVICDTAHNIAGMSYIVEQLKHRQYHQLHMVLGIVEDKDITGILAILPKEAIYYFTKASVKRALPENELMEQGLAAGLKGEAYPTVTDAVKAALQKSLPEDFIFVGGSNFVVADLLANRDTFNFDQRFLG